MGEATNRCINVVKWLIQIVTWVNREMVPNQYCSGQVLVFTDICILRERVYCHSTVVGYGSQIKTL